jgi:outer membrane autotransporter protein
LQAPLPGSPAGSRYVLLGLPDIEAFQIPLITTTAQNVFNETALAWLDHQDEVRNWMRDSNCRQGLAAGSGADLYIKSPICQPGGAGSWLKAIGSWTDRNVTQSLGDIAPAASVLTPFDLGYRQSTYALYGGLDFGREALATAYDAGVMGLMAGYIESHVNFKSSPTRFDYTGGTVGVSGTYINGGFFLDGLAKADILEMKGSFPTLAPSAIPSQSLQVINMGGLGNIGYRWDVARLFYLEPIGSVSYVLTHVNNFDVPGLSVQFSDGQSLRGALGVRTGVNWLENSAYQIDTSLTAKVWGEFLGNNPVNFVSVSTDPNAVPLTLNDKVSRVFAEVAAQANFTNKGTGWSGFLNTTMRFNDQFTTISGRTGVRYQW